MARYLGSVCKLCRREGEKLFLKATRCDTPKCAVERRKSAPGMHGMKRGKMTEYGMRLREKQKLKRFYGMLETPFRRFFEVASRSPQNTGEQLLGLMERRLDNVVHRLGFAGNRAGARQMVTHGHVRVNNRRVNIASFLVKPGDTISIKDRKGSQDMAKMWVQQQSNVPDFLQRTSEEPPEGKMTRMPTRDDVDPRIKHIREQLIIEISTR
jgi:small subunit ribosomal protein S4